MSQYPKIQTLYKRELVESGKPAGIIIGQYSKPEFENIINWEVSEKLHGTNVRVIWDGKNIKFRGKTDRADLPDFLLKNLEKLFDKKKFKKVFEDKLTILYGEGIGDRIQDIGKKYSKESFFVLFDIKIGEFWLEREDIEEIARKIKTKTVPLIGIMKKDKIEEFVKSKPSSILAKEKLEMEGIVARAHPQILFRDRIPIMFKLKVNDYRKTGTIK